MHAEQISDSAKSPPLVGTRSILARFGNRYGVDPKKVMNTLKQTAFRVRDGQVSDEQMMALLIVAEQHNLNPFLKEIYAFPDKNNGIVPVVGVDGWNRIMNEHPQMNGISFAYSDNKFIPEGADREGYEWIECTIYRKDRDHPVVIREYLDEVYRPPSRRRDGSAHKGPWQTHTIRFHRHKTQIQAARIAFGFTGIYDEDEASRIVDARAIDGEYEQVQVARTELPSLGSDQFDQSLGAWQKHILAGDMTPEEVLAMVQTRNSLSVPQIDKILSIEPPSLIDPDGPIPGLDDLEATA